MQSVLLDIHIAHVLRCEETPHEVWLIHEQVR